MKNIPWGIWDEWGCWHHNPRLMMSAAEQYMQNVENGYIKLHRSNIATSDDITREMKLMFELGCASDMISDYYNLEMTKAKIRKQPYFNGGGQ